MTKHDKYKEKSDESLTDLGPDFDHLIEFEEFTDYVIDDNGIFIPLKKRSSDDTVGLISKTKKPKLDVNESDNIEVKKSKLKKKKSLKKKKKDKTLDKINGSHNEEACDNDQKIEIEPWDGTSRIEGMEGWVDMFVPNQILQCLKELKFTNPTPIQSLVLPSAIRDKMDIIGAAETGSGKTLAFAIPIITHILDLKSSHDDGDDDDDDEEEEIYDRKYKLVETDILDDADYKMVDDVNLSDTDSCMQNYHDSDEVNDNDIEVYDDDDNGSEDGELEDDKDEKSDDNDGDYDDDDDDYNDDGDDQHDKPMYALIITPTRELAIQIKDHIENITKYTDIKCTAIVGGMSVDKQNRLLKCSPEIVVATPGRLWELIQQKCPHVSHMAGLRYLVIDEADRMVERNHYEELEQIINYMRLNSFTPLRRQNFVFSATLTFIHKTPYRFDVRKKKKMKEMTIEDKLDALRQKLNMSGKPKIVDLTRGKDMVAQKLLERRIDCTYPEKDLYLYYFIRKYPGRTLVFANSKDCIRRLTSLLTILQCHPMPLHADMHQRQRLKNLDRFKDNERGLLLATDVAARGLDIPNVKHVIHFQVPRTAENYVHRSGRTARSNTEGLSLTLVSPEENKLFRGILAALKRDKDLDKLEIDRQLYLSVSNIVTLARDIETEEHRMNKEKVKHDWIQQACIDADLIVDDDDDSELNKNSVFLEDETRMRSDKMRKLNALKEELNHLLGTKYSSKSKKRKLKKKKKQVNTNE